MNGRRPAACIVGLLAVLLGAGIPLTVTGQSVAREWNELLLDAIRRDFARPPVHARNLLHLSIVMWDAWAAYEPGAAQYLASDRARTRFDGDVEFDREEAISYAAYRLLQARFASSPGEYESLTSFTNAMDELGFDPEYSGTIGSSPAALGNRIAVRMLAMGLSDGANEAGNYAYNNGYRPVNPAMPVADSGPGLVRDFNRWQPLILDVSVDQAGNSLPDSAQIFLGPHWGQVAPFALNVRDRGPALSVYHDPGPPPGLDGPGREEYQQMFLQNIRFSSMLTPDDDAKIDISPASMWNNPLGTTDGAGYPMNPVTGLPYAPNVVRRGDWARVIAEFWADGPASETPPGHWNTLANYVSDNVSERRVGGSGQEVSQLEWEVKLYLALNGAVHDAAVAAWGIKGYYDYVRPITAIRYMCSLGQSSDASVTPYHPHGLPLEDGLVEVITPMTTSNGGRHARLRGYEGELAVYAWRGISDRHHSGVGWIRCADWVPYQRDTFVTPPFAGYVSGHSTFSRAAAEVLTAFTGSPFFPGGLGSWFAPKDDFLFFETGPSVDLTLQWATYYDAADEAGISRLYGGIHPWADDFPGRILGSIIGTAAWKKAQTYYSGTANPFLHG